MIAAAATTLRLLPLKNFYTKVKKASVLQQFFTYSFLMLKIHLTTATLSSLHKTSPT
jgi:hypothetical protein